MLQLTLAVLLAFVMFASKTVSIKRYHSFAGPFKLDFKRAEPCPDQAVGPHAVSGSLDIQKRRHKPTIFGINLTSPVAADDSLVIKGNLASWSNMGGWKPNAYDATIRTPCTMAFRHFRPHVEYVMNFVFGEVLQCPFLAGVYRVYNLTVPDSLTKSSSTTFVNQFIYGRWRAEGRAYMKSGEMVACGRVYVDTVPN